MAFTGREIFSIFKNGRVQELPLRQFSDLELIKLAKVWRESGLFKAENDLHYYRLARSVQ